MAMMTKADWVQLGQSLLAKENRCEKELLSALEALKLAELLPCDISTEAASLLRRVADAKLSLTELQQKVADSQPSPSFIQDLAARISSFTALLNRLKASQRQAYSALLQQEQQLQDELGCLPLDVTEDLDHHNSSRTTALAFELPHGACGAGMADTGQQQGRALHAPDSPSKAAAPHAAAAAAKSPRRPCSSSSGSSSTLLPDVVAHDAFLARHGSSGGWHPDDHATFLAVLRSCRGDYAAALPCVLDALPALPRKAVIAHCCWHADLTELDMRRRVALISWRSARDAAKTARQAEASALGDAHGQQLQALAQPDQQGKEARQLQKALVQQWRQERQQQQLAQQQRELEVQRQQQERERARLLQRRLALRQQLEAAQAAQAQAEAAGGGQQGHAQAAAPVQPAPTSQEQQQEVQQRLQQRNDQAARRRQQLLDARQAKQAARELLQQRLLASTEPPPVARSPGRLLSATAAAAARAAAAAADRAEGAGREGGGGGTAIGSSRGPISSGFVLQVAHKAVPGWLGGRSAR